MNSLAVLLGFLAFVALGHWCLVRVFYQKQFDQPVPPLRVWLSTLTSQQTASYLSQSHLFLSLPTISVLLFWGWGPALLWLSVSYLLIETPANFLFTNVKKNRSNKSSSFILTREILCYLLLIFFSSAVLSLLINLFDGNNSLGFVIGGVLFALHVITKQSNFSAIEKTIVALFGLIFGLSVMSSIQLSFDGQWVPFPSLAKWVIIDNSLLLAMLILTGAYWLGNQTVVQQNLSRILAVVIICLIFLLLASLVWLQPDIVVPSLAANLLEPEQGATPPNFLAVSLLLFISSISIIHQSTVARLIDKPSMNASLQFMHAQVANFLILLLSLGVFLWLASSAIQINWFDIYSKWSNLATLQEHFMRVFDAIIVSNRSTVLGFGLNSNVFERWQFIFLISLICLLGFCSLLTLSNLLSIQSRTLAKAFNQKFSQENTSIANNVKARLNHRYFRYTAITLSALWMHHNGISLQLWMGFMLIAWALASHALLHKAVSLPAKSSLYKALHSFALGFFTFGFIQAICFIIIQFFAHNWIMIAYLISVLGLACLLCSKCLINSVLLLWQRQNSTLFD